MINIGSGERGGGQGIERLFYTLQLRGVAWNNIHEKAVSELLGNHSLFIIFLDVASLSRVSSWRLDCLKSSHLSFIGCEISQIHQKSKKKETSEVQ